ncbi:discoidin domain-containing protein [Luteolibacter arcticus]|uniref:Discoidin domain-containing protein n=1 Tax=Luteolibacter arcticus TaxID=1581411 RepID=A0ABT3GK55_9BACT|nr:discoidin domain-containing protein [Luteolibacter arcticus]MCW1923898.1 discoidin domain-containing protein [Luteolibacter arcticus]
MTFYTALWLSLAALVPCTAQAAPVTRARDFTEALELAKPTGSDIVVLQRGSDWNRLGETLYRKVWQTTEFESQLGDGFVLVTVDRPETPGAPALGSTDDPAGMARFRAATGPGAALPANEVASVRAEGGANFKKRADGTWLLDDPKGEHNPARDTLVLNLRAGSGGQILRLDFLPDPSLPNGGAGRASNGNFALTEVIVVNGDKALATTSAWSNSPEGAAAGGLLVDGIVDQPKKAWNGGGQTRQARTMMLALAQPVRPGATLKISLVGRSQWNNHIPACLRAAVLDDARLAASLTRVAAAETLATRNAAFTWWDGNRCPRVALVDSEGRGIAALDTPRGDLLPATLAAQIKKLRETRIARDEWLAKAANAKGPEQAELLRKSLEVLGAGNWTGNGHCYKPVHDQIRAADPQDISGAVRWLGFSSDPKGAVPWVKPTWNEALDTQRGKRALTDADYREALARVDKELADPRNKVLSHENIQRMMVAKFRIYKSWKGREDERFRIQQEIADFDPDTFWGVGARGYIGMYGRSETPYLTYGWKPGQVKAGTNTWKMADTGYFFAHPGSYKVALTHAAGASIVKVKRLALLEGDTVLAEAKPDADLGPGKARVEAILDFASWNPDRRYILIAEIEAAAGQTNSSGRFSVEPWLTEPAAAVTTDHFKVRRELRDKLTAAFEPHRNELDRALASDTIRLDLARHELIRRCGPETVDQIAARSGGAEFLQAFTGDVAWLESFLANDDAKWPQALENLRFLHRNCGDLAPLLHRTLATAMALEADGMNRYRLLDRYRDILRTHREGLLHVSFESLDTREMRWAIPLAGTARDYRFMVDTMQARLRDYLGACWRIAYIDPNVYGYSVQGWGFIDPWTHREGTGTGDRPFPIHRTVGGVCGTLSGFGAGVAKAHGVMSTTVGQPAHCAYVVRVGEEWPTGNDVSGPETNVASVYEGTGFPTMHRLYEVVHGDKPAYLRSSRLAWAAHVYLDRRQPLVRVMPGLKYSVFDLPGGKIDKMAKLQPVNSGTADSFNLSAVLPVNPVNFGVLWEGEVELSGDGPFMVQVKSDGVSRLTVGSQTVAGNQPLVELKLRAGVHPVRLEYGQGIGKKSLAVNWSGPATWNADWSGGYLQAITAQPLHYPLLLETIKAFENASDLPKGTWQKLIAQIARAYAPYHEAAWALVNRCYGKVAPTLTPAERLALLLECHRQITQAKAPKFMGYNLARVLNTQAASLGDPALESAFLEELLGIHFSENPATSRVFGDVLNWGRTRFAAKPEMAAAFAKSVGSFFAASGGSLGADRMRQQITAGIRAASTAGDLSSWRLWTEMADRFLPPLEPGYVHLTAAQAKAAPKLPLSGSLLSKDGLLQTSSSSKHDRPLSYGAVLDGSAPGWFDTNAEEKPWAQVMLAGEAEITAIVAVNRYEYAQDKDEFQWAAPFKVLVSTDGKTWTEAATRTTAEAVMRVDLSGKPRARYVRLERQAPSGTSKPPGRFHLRNFLVYGRKLY